MTDQKIEKWADLPIDRKAELFLVAVAAFATFVYAGVAICQLRSLDASVRATERSIDAAQHSAQIQTRPWVLFDNEAAHQITVDGLHIHVRNFGNSPAFQVYWSLQEPDDSGALCDPETVPFISVPRAGPGRPILPPQQPSVFFLPREQFPTAPGPWKRLLRIGWRDQYNAAAFAELCLSVDGIDPDQLRVGDLKQLSPAPMSTPAKRIVMCQECNRAAYHQDLEGGEILIEPKLFDAEMPNPSATGAVRHRRMYIEAGTARERMIWRAPDGKLRPAGQTGEKE